MDIQFPDTFMVQRVGNGWVLSFLDVDQSAPPYVMVYEDDGSVYGPFLSLSECILNAIGSMARDGDSSGLEVVFKDDVDDGLI